MSQNQLHNVSHSIHQRLLNKAKQANRPFSELLQYYAMERFLFRLSKSQYVSKYVLKGALMLRVWNTPMSRPTMDIDMLGKTSNDVNNILNQFSQICSIKVEPDGLDFDDKSIIAENITQDSEYKGLRLRFKAYLGKARINMQIDIGFGDIVFPKPISAFLPTILDLEPPQLYCYSKESVIAEKLQAMVQHGKLNSRMKDFYDIWLLSKQFDFQGNVLLESIDKTFSNRQMQIPENMTAFTADFASDKQIQWQLFCKRLPYADTLKDFGEIIGHVSEFLKPVTNAIITSANFNMNWVADKGWMKS